MNNYCLDPQKIVETIARLQARINDRFPDSGLSGVCGDILAVAKLAKQESSWLGRKIGWIRIVGIAVCLGLIAVPILTAVMFVRTQGGTIGPTEFIQIAEAAMNDVVLLGAAVFFLLTLEVRLKRKRALQSVHKLRAIAHVIDMHQLTKDPERIISSSYRRTESSPEFTMTRDQLGRYLDYCSEMLSLTGKIAAIYIQKFDDSVTVSSVNEIENLTTGLSRKIWQKILILNEYSPPSAAAHASSSDSALPS